MRAYDSDFAGWAADTARAIIDGRWSDIDRANLAEEIASLGRSERDKIISAYRVLLSHLLKFRYQPERLTRSWEVTILEQRRRIERLFEDNPSLKAKSVDIIAVAYEEARFDAARETGLALDIFPEMLPFTGRDIEGQS